MRSRRLRAVILGLLAIPAIAAAATAPTPDSRATALLTDLRQTTHAPSVSAAVAVHGRIVYSHAVGLADLARNEAATPETVYNVGSVSKAITAVAVVQLVEAGKVRLQDPIQRYAPTFPDKGQPITVWNLLTHTSGIRHYRIHDFPGPDWEENHHPYASIDEAIGIFARDPLLFPPGKYYFYSSYGVNLLQAVVERASGQPFEDYLRQHVWAPAGMTSTAFDRAGRKVAHRAVGYTGGVKPTPTGAVDVSYKYASGGMLSTAEDLTRLGVALNAGKLMGATARAQMWAPQVPVVHRFQEHGPVATERYQQGLLWRIVHRDGGRWFAYHCGTFNGFNACLLDYPDEDIVVAMTLNAEEGGFRPAEALADVFRPATPGKPTRRP